MRERIKITKGEFVTSSILFIWIIVCTLYYQDNKMLLNWLGIYIFFYCNYSWHKKTKSPWFSSYFIFSLFFVLFNYGQPIMWALGIHKTREIGKNMLYYGSGFFPNTIDVSKAQLYTCLAMVAFHFGAIIFAKRKNSYTDNLISANIDESVSDLIKASMRVVCGVILAFVGPFAVYSAVKDFIVARVYGYGALYYGDYSTQGGYGQILMYVFFPAIVGTLISNDYSRRARFFSYFFFGTYAVLELLSGDRGNWLYSLIILIWLHSFYNKISLRKYLFYGVFTLLGIYILSAITSIRDSGINITILDILGAFNAENSPVVDAFFEMGGSMGIITFFLAEGNSIYPYANTYLTSVLGVISSRVLSLFGLKQVLIADWFSQEYLGVTWGTGFSMVGEAFVNGGYFGGLVYMFMIGIIIGKILQVASDKTKIYNPLKLFVTTAGLNAIIGFSRGALYLTLKEFFYGTLIVVFLIKILVRIANR